MFKINLKKTVLILTISIFSISSAIAAEECFEKTSRAIFKFNMAIDDVVLEPISKGYNKLPDPIKIGNSGSFFKNPVIDNALFEGIKAKFPKIVSYPAGNGKMKIAAGWLIDQAGWKGKTIGSYGVHKNQALVLVNYGGSSGRDIYKLSEEIIQSIKEVYGINLEREVNIL